jgi:hypothetical protein
MLLMSTSTVPLALGTIAASLYLRKGKTNQYRRSLWGSTAAGLVALGLLYGSLFGSDLSSSSTAGLIFLFAPIYSAIGLGLGYAFGAIAHRVSATSAETAAATIAISVGSRRALWIPIAMLSVLLIGIIRYCVLNNDLAVAERASNPETLQWIFDKVAQGSADPFGVPLFLAQNPNAPTHILDQLSRHEHSSVRTFVARHPNTSMSVIASMRNDCDPQIRKEVQERLQRQQRSNAEIEEAPNCGAADRAR